jgi:hypothetical protein
MGYTKAMKLEVVFKPSAFKHGATEVDIRHCIATAIYDGPMEGYENKYLRLGFDTKANPLEIYYNEFGENGMNVFHAMATQQIYLPLYTGRG